jgi:hypothetical protein
MIPVIRFSVRLYSLFDKKYGRMTSIPDFKNKMPEAA